ncbi:MAG TPA: hypothetical protein VFQ71_09415 [Gaiellales bacterium]|jgi:hypothetical protein|nr:hypothetical protein [Gaiellales bacterium]
MKRLSAGLLAAVAVALAAPGAAAAAPRHPAMVSQPQLVITPSQGGVFDFGAVQPGQAKRQWFRVTGARWGWQGSGAVQLTGSPAFSIVWNGCARHHRWWWRSCFVLVRYAPAAAGASDRATLSASTTAPWCHGLERGGSGGSAAITLTGSSPAGSGSGGTGGTGGGDPGGPPGVDVSDATFTGVKTGFGNQFSFSFDQVEQTVTHTFTATNNSTTATLVLDPLAETQLPMVVNNDTCGGRALAPGASCTFDVTFDTTGCPGLGFDDGVSITGGALAVTYAQVDVSGAC